MEYYNKYFEGFFWISENEKCKITATLHIDLEGNATISSLQPLVKNEENNLANRDWTNIDVVLGYINSHDDSKTFSIKLYDIFQFYQSSGALMKYKYKSHSVFLSDTFDENISEPSYNSIMLHSKIISNWIKITGFKLDKKVSEKFVVNQLYEQPEQIDLFKNKDYYIYIYFRASSGFPARRKSYINEEVFINIETTNNFSVNGLYKLKNTIERLLNIILFVPFYSGKAEFKSISNKTYKSLKKPKELEGHLRERVEFELFKNNSQQIFTNWFEKQSKLELVIKNFFSVYGQKGVLVENRFLTYISVLENYHRNNISLKETKSVLKKYFKTIVFRKYNEVESPNFQQRLIFILHDSYISSNIDDIKKYTEILRDTRDFHTHLLDSKEDKSLNCQHILKANQLFEAVIREVLLKEIGVNEFNKDLSNLPLIKTDNLDILLNQKI